MQFIWLILSGVVLLLVISVFIAKKLFPGISYSSLKKLQLNAEVIKTLPQLVLTINRSGCILHIHNIPSGFEQHFDINPEGKSICDFLHSSFHDSFTNTLKKTASSGISGSFQYCFQFDNSVEWFEGEVAKISEENFLVSIMNITGHRIIKEKLSISFDSQKMTTFLLDSENGTIIFDREDYISKWVGRKVSRVMSISNMMNLVSSSQARKLTEAIERVINHDEEIHAVKLKLDTEDSSKPYWVSVRGYVLENGPEASSSLFLGVMQDITDSVVAEQQISNHNSMLTNLLDNLPVALYWKDKNFKYQGASSVFLKHCQVNSTDYLDEQCWITERSRQIEQQIMVTGFPILNRQEKLQLPGLSDRTINISRIPLKSSAGDVTGLMTTYVDVTENNLFRDQLIKRKEFLAGLVDNLPVGFFAKDPSSGLTYRIWNREMEEIFGFSASMAVEKRDWNLFGTKAAAQLKIDDDLMLTDPASGKEPKIYRLQGVNGLRTVSMTRVLLYDDLLDSTLIAGVLDDITRENELEDQLRQSQKMEGIGRLAGGVAHDFNNILQVIMGAAEMGAGGKSSAEKSFKQVLQAGEKAMFLTRQLLSFSREESFSKKVFLVDHRVGEFVRMVHRIIGTNAKLEFVAGVPGAKINGDPFQLEQVLMNLLVNARDAIPPGENGFINVETSISMVSCVAGSEPVECVVISVSDTGTGIPEEIRDKIFEPFFTTKADGKGTGLGLASSYGIVNRHGGILLVDSELGKGTRFDVCIPLSSQSEEEIIESAPLTEHTDQAIPLTILLAEDEEMVREIAVLILESAGHTVIEALNGLEAVELFIKNQSRIDLLIFDAMMPVMNGSEAYRKIEELNNKIPALFCTGYSGETLLNLFTNTKKVSVLQKPYSSAELLESVKNLTS